MSARESRNNTLLRGRWPFMLALFFAILPFGSGTEGVSEGSGIRQFVLIVLFLSSTLAIVSFPQRLRLLRDGVPPSLILLLMYVALSVGWSVNPWVSFKRALQIFGVVVLALGLLVGGNGQFRLHRVMPPVLWAGMALALVFTAAFPGYAFSELGYRAFLSTKNNFGQLAVLCVLMPLALVVLEPQANRWVWLPLAVLGVAGLVISRSATAGVALLVVAVTYGAFEFARGIGRSWLPVLLGAGLLLLAGGFAAVVVLGFPSIDKLLALILSPVGREATLAGRTNLWELMVHQGLRHPWFGAGFGGFWLGFEGDSGQIAHVLRYYPGQAHNGYLDLFNELGGVGCALVLLIIFQHLHGIVVLTGRQRALGFFHLGIVILLLVLNLAEAAILKTTHLWWTIFIASVIEVRFLVIGKSSGAPSAGRQSSPAGTR